MIDPRGKAVSFDRQLVPIDTPGIMGVRVSVDTKRHNRRFRVKVSVFAATAAMAVLVSSVSWAGGTEELTIIGKKKIFSGSDSVDVFVAKKMKNGALDKYEYYGNPGGAALNYGYQPAGGVDVIFPAPYTGIPVNPIAINVPWTGYLDNPTSEKVTAKSTMALLGRTYPSLEILISSVEGFPMVKKWHLDGVGLLGAESLISGFNYYSRLDSFTILGGSGYMPLAVGNTWHFIVSDTPIVGVKEEIPRGFALYPASPNPFNPATVIRFDVPSSAHVRLAVYDILGREVTVLREGELSAGSYSSTWDGRDHNGALAGSGVYFYRLSAGSLNAGGKIMFLR
jgi:hypothetical protein